ncbi:MAG: hypothetical protein Q4A71_00415 [Actinomycetaceae bacterium]|nr:hypothetical protein [Actinomycetaceae bacterium]
MTTLADSPAAKSLLDLPPVAGVRLDPTDFIKVASRQNLPTYRVEFLDIQMKTRVFDLEIWEEDDWYAEAYEKGVPVQMVHPDLFVQMGSVQPLALWYDWICRSDAKGQLHRRNHDFDQSFDWAGDSLEAEIKRVELSISRAGFDVTHTDSFAGSSRKFQEWLDEHTRLTPAKFEVFKVSAARLAQTAPHLLAVSRTQGTEVEQVAEYRVEDPQDVTRFDDFGPDIPPFSILEGQMDGNIISAFHGENVISEDDLPRWPLSEGFDSALYAVTLKNSGYYALIPPCSSQVMLHWDEDGAHVTLTLADDMWQGYQNQLARMHVDRWMRWYDQTEYIDPEELNGVALALSAVAIEIAEVEDAADQTLG